MARTPMRIVAWIALAVLAAAAGAARAQTDGPYPAEPILQLNTEMHTAPIRRIDVDAAGRFVVSGSHDKTVRVWSLADGRLLRTIRVPAAPGDVGKVYAVAISPDGAHVAVGGYTGEFGDHRIYIFGRESGDLLQQISGIIEVVFHLTYSPDGRYLAATLGGSNGLRVYETREYTEAARDADYSDRSYWATFDARGRLATTSYDGRIRLYDHGFNLVREVEAPGGDRPFGIAFSPDGRRLAVGYTDSIHVDVLDADTLRHRAQTATDAGHMLNLGRVAWSPDGRILWAGARGRGTGPRVFRWTAGDLAAGTSFDVSDNTVMGVHPLRDGRVVIGAADPLLALLDGDGTPVWARRGQIADFRDQTFGRSIRVSADGTVVRFGYEAGGSRPAQVLVHTGELEAADPGEADLTLPETAAPGLDVADWYDEFDPTLNGTPLPLRPYELSRRLAVVPGGQQFALGAEWSLYLFDRRGRQVWRVDAPGTVWSLNVSGGGRLVVAAFGDGTIRWYDRETGAERLAFFPHADGERWIAWTPEGFYNASPGGEELIGYLLNRGAEQGPLFVTGAQIREVFFRPDLVARALDDDRAAIAQAVAEAGDLRSVLLGDGLPPEVTLIGPAEVTLDGTTYELRLTVTDRGGGIGALEVRVNGAVIAPRQVEMPRRPHGQAPGSVARTRAILELPPGRHEIEARVRNADGTVTSGPVVAAVTARGAAPPATLYVLAVGVDDYLDGGFRLNHAVNDAETVAATLEQVAGALYADVHVQTLTERGVTVDGFRAAVAGLTERMRETDAFAPR